MKKAYENFEVATKEVENHLVSSFLTPDTVMSMSEKEFELMQLLFKMVEASNNLKRETINHIDSIERKLDTLLARKES